MSPNHDLVAGAQDACQICGSANLIEVLDLGHQAPCDSLLWPKHLRLVEKIYPLQFVRCGDCGLAQINYVVEPSELFFPEYPYRSGITPTLVTNLKSTGPKIKSRFGLSSGDLAIDIGSNDGTLLKGFKDAGMRVLGIEPTNIACIANEAGIETIQQFFDESVAAQILETHGRAAVITAANMFAHVSKLGSLIRGVEALLCDGGLFVTESHYLGDLLSSVQYDSIYHEHLKYYSVESIQKLFSYYEFTVVDVEQIPNYGGSIRVYAMKGRGHQVGTSVARLLKEEREYGLDNPSCWDRFATAVKESRRQLRELIVDGIREGSSFVGVGCPGRSATLVNYCNLTVQELKYIAEQANSLKLGLYLPGAHIPIIDEDEMLKNQPDFAILLSWHYWEPIARKLREKGLRSRLVLPLPTVKIIDI